MVMAASLMCLMLLCLMVCFKCLVAWLKIAFDARVFWYAIKTAVTIVRRVKRSFMDWTGWFIDRGFQASKRLEDSKVDRLETDTYILRRRTAYERLVNGKSWWRIGGRCSDITRMVKDEEEESWIADHVKVNQQQKKITWCFCLLAPTFSNLRTCLRSRKPPWPLCKHLFLTKTQRFRS